MADYNLGYTKALFSFKGNFNLNMGTVYMDVVDITTNKYMRLRFATNPTFVTYILTYSRHTIHSYYINNDFIEDVNYTYTP